MGKKFADLAAAAVSVRDVITNGPVSPKAGEDRPAWYEARALEYVAMAEAYEAAAAAVPSGPQRLAIALAFTDAASYHRDRAAENRSLARSWSDGDL
ncbi:MAG TPA: hypothetical protein VJ914_40285 [Pseudonocardiaceae bacterium]|nr:hypothetical protein [Pseudonocardiaceae bacterium]